MKYVVLLALVAIGFALIYYTVETRTAQNEFTLKHPDVLTPEAARLDTKLQQQRKFSVAKDLVLSGNGPRVRDGLTMIKRLANGGDAQAMEWLGWFYLGISGFSSAVYAEIPRNPVRAVKWLDAAAKAGSISAREGLTVGYVMGTLNGEAPAMRAAEGLEIPTGCLTRNQFTAAVQNVIPPRAFYSGLEILAGSASPCASAAYGCRVYTKSDFEKLWNAPLLGDSSEALFAIVPCHLAEDSHEQVRRETLIETLLGSWCGRSKDGSHPGGEIRITFSRREGHTVVGHAVETWPKKDGGPLGELGHVQTLDLFPSVEDSTWTILSFSEGSRYRNGARWSLDTQDNKLTTPGSLGPYDLSRSCDGFWQ